MGKKIWDIAVVGCGPAGLSAAINARIRNREVILLGPEVCSTSLRKAPEVNNYLGFTAVKGEELIQRFLIHISSFGLTVTRKKIDSIYALGDIFHLISQQEVIQAKSVIISSGVNYPSVLAGEQEYLGKGLGYCATCDGPLYRDKDVAIIAHSADGEEEARFLAEICRKVYYLPRYKNPRPLGAKVEVVTEKPKEIKGQVVVQAIDVQGKTIPVDGVFIVGSEAPPERLVPGVEISDGHYKVDRDMCTNIPGLYAAGDCTGRPYQLAKAVGEGQVAGLAASQYVAQKEAERK